jgi:hypothetical protein
MSNMRFKYMGNDTTHVVKKMYTRNYNNYLEYVEFMKDIEQREHDQELLRQYENLEDYYNA